LLVYSGSEVLNSKKQISGCLEEKVNYRLILFIGFWLLHSPGLLAQLSAPVYSATDTILILGAVPQEITVLTDALDESEQDKLLGIPYWRGSLYGKPVIIAITGVGKTYTAMTTTLMLQEFRPRFVVMTGTGARINPDIRTGDVIVARVTNMHDFGSLNSERMDFRPLKGPVNGNSVVNRFEVDEESLAIATAAISDYEPQAIVADDLRYENEVRLGIVSSSDLFGVPSQRIATLKKEFQTDIMEMESAPFALVCQSFGVPYLIVRSGSNLAQEEPNSDYLRFGPIAAREAAKFTHHLLKYL
jgi:adenosylhomocysteine nucleosidase